MINLSKIPIDKGYYIAGFCDGEGSFNVSFRKRNDYKLPWKVSLCFNVSQKEKVILTMLKKHFQCGTLRQRKDGIWYFEVNNVKALNNNIVPFFDQFKFLSSKKKRDFSKFKQILYCVNNLEHLTKDGIIEILSIRKNMNDGGKRKYSDAFILMELRKSSETTR